MAYSDAHSDFAAVMMSGNSADRAAHYRREAEKFRQMAQAEFVEHIRESLLSVVKQYDDLAASLTPPKA